jgi:hypothetical protein
MKPTDIETEYHLSRQLFRIVTCIWGLRDINTLLTGGHPLAFLCSSDEGG